MTDKLTKAEVAELLREHDRLGAEIDRLAAARDEIIYSICMANGPCPQCRNWHYPYCGGLR